MENKTTPDPEREETMAALRHLAVATCVMLFGVGLTYIVPGLAELQPWSPDDPVPLVRLFADEREDVPAFAGAGEAYSGAEVETSLAEELGDSVAANLGTDTVPPPTDDEQRARRPLGVIAEAEFAGIEQRIEDEGFRGLAPFFEQLERTFSQEPGALTRISHWGDSSIATDLITYTMRRRLQQRFGDGGHGFILTAKVYLPYKHRDVEHSASSNWLLKELTRGQLREGRYGFGGYLYSGRTGSYGIYGTSEGTPVGGAVSRFEIYYQRYPRGGRLRVRVDDEANPRTLETRSEVVEDAVERIEVPDGAHKLGIRYAGGGQPRVYGVVLEREGPGVVYDSLGIVGARARRLLNYDAEHIQGQIATRGTNLIVLGFGGNEASDTVHLDRYRDDFVSVIERMRGDREDIGCLVLAPLDQAHKVQRAVRTYESIPTIVAAQKAAAAQAGCAFFNTFEAMGGQNSMLRWYRSRPRLAMGDFRHATPAGYQVIGNLFYKALLQAFVAYRTQQAGGAGEQPVGQGDPVEPSGAEQPGAEPTEAEVAQPEAAAGTDPNQGANGASPSEDSAEAPAAATPEAPAE